IINAFHNGKESHVDDEVLWRMDGSCFPVEYRSIPILSAGKAIGSVVSFSDITARLDAEEKEQDRFNKLIRYKNAMAEIVRFSETIAKGVGIESIQKRILKTLAIALDVARTSIWFYSDDHNSIVLSNLFKKSEDAYESGRVLNSKDYPNYFSALAEDTIIAADDAMIDPHTCEFKDSYLKSLGITSMIHVPIRIKGRTVGAICIEHTGKMRQWDLYEQEFTTSVSISLALVIESNERTKSEARHKMVLETMIDGLITINKAGMIESFNPAAEEIFGYSAEEVIGKDIILLMPESYRSGHHQSLDRHNKTGEVHILGKTGIEVEGLRKNGSIFPIAISISEMFIGGQHHYSGVMRDITERKVLEHERERATEELTQLIDTANAPIFGIDTQGRVNEWNQQAAKISGYSKAEVVGQDLVKGFITEEYKKPVKDILDDALQGKETANYEFPLYTKDGNRIDILLNATTRRDTLGNITGVIGVGQDITELRIKEHALNQAQKMEAVGQLTGGIAHDFNNLLSIISGNLSFLQQDIGSTTVEINELFEDAMSAVNDGAELTQRLLAFSSSRTLQPENKNVNYVIQKFARFLKRTLGEKIELIIDLPIESLFISVDPSQLDNALLNLSINARDAMPQGGIITIAAARYHFTDTDTDTDDNYELSLSVGDYILISVVDTGSGINSDDLEHVFEPFFTTKELGKGSGLGLSMVYGFTRQSRGGCHIRSTLGKGTTVSMFFPEVDAVRDIDKKTKEHEYLSMYGSEVILVVEDEPRVRKVVLRDLKKLGYKTLEADNAELAITIIKSGAHIDLLFSDVLMPGTMDGYMLAKWTKEHYPYIKVVLTSGYSKGKSDLSEDRIRLFPLIRKPYTIDKLAKLIRAALTE
ncbi:MAG: PAS domain S-box protein, partial [Methylomarinum sp.]|nr:PAS domain S-box protein [Methylomarinum sp.]